MQLLIVHAQKDETHKTRSVHWTATFKLENRSDLLAGYEPKVEGIRPGLRRSIAGPPCASETMSVMARRRRQVPGEGGEDDPDDQGGLHLQDRQLEDDQLALEDGEEEGEETLEGPKGPPTTNNSDADDPALHA